MGPIRTAAVIGAGTMGTGIATHLAGAGVRCHLLDIVPPGAVPSGPVLPGAAAGKPAERSKLAIEALQRAEKGGAFLDLADRPLVVPGNIEDDLERLRECDWIVEAIVERPETKRDLFRRIAPYRKPEAIVSSNTSGISLKILTEGMDRGFQQHFLITHFFNPPRWMYLLEVVPGPETLPDVLHAIETFSSLRLGKGVVRCKDTPNFIANRIGVFAMAIGARLMEEENLTIEEIDAITARPMARPKTGSFSLLDLVGIDVAKLVQENARMLLANDESRDIFAPTPLLNRMVAEGRLGRKSGAGFYKKVGKDLLVLDTKTFEYRQPRPVRFDSLDAAGREKTPGARLKAVISGGDAAARYAWRLLSAILLYTARRIPEIADDIVSVDRAVRWGFSWDLGPFEAWDAIGVEESVQRMQAEGQAIPPLVKTLLSSGRKTFYDRIQKEGRSRRGYFDLPRREVVVEPERPGVLQLDEFRSGGKPIRSNSAASLWHIGDGVLCAEFHSKMNTLTSDSLDIVRAGVDEVERGGYAGLVIGNDGPHFSAGANIAELAGAAREKRWDSISGTIRQFHEVALRVRYSSKPVVAAVRGLALGGGCEIPLACHRIQAASETNMGLVELGVGLIPAGGGTRELACRAAESIPPGVEADIFPFVRKAFETIGMGKTSTSAMDARSIGLLREADGISMDRERPLADAKAQVLCLAATGFRPPRPRLAVRAAGAAGLAEIRVIIHLLRSAGEISEYDAFLAGKLALVLCGGEIDEDLPVGEQHFLDLEREVFVSLLGEQKTLDRIDHMLKTGKPLRN